VQGNRRLHAILALFRESEDKDEARARRDAILERFGGIPELKRARSTRTRLNYVRL